jgi:predicted DNA-binding protein with PD1-like motif
MNLSPLKNPWSWHPHFHMVVSDLEQAYTGHLEEGTTALYLVEISLLELKNVDLVRVPDEHTIAKLRSKIKAPK